MADHVLIGFSISAPWIPAVLYLGTVAILPTQGEHQNQHYEPHSLVVFQMSLIAYVVSVSVMLVDGQIMIMSSMLFASFKMSQNKLC